MKTKTLALFSGIVGLVGGILLLVGPFFILGTAAATASSDATAGSILLLNALKIANLVLGIIAIVYYKGDERVGVAPSVLLIVGGSVAIIPLEKLIKSVYEEDIPIDEELMEELQNDKDYNI